MNEGTTNHWHQLSEKQQLIVLISDTYKDVNGFRPRYLPFNEWTVEALRNYLSELQAEAGNEMEWEQEELRADEEAKKEAMKHKPFLVGDILSIAL